jgi:hypothetical protein
MDANDIKNLVFFAVAIAAWVVQAILKRKQEDGARQEVQASRQQRGTGAEEEPAPTRPGMATRAAADPDGLPDVVFGRRPLPPRYTQSRTSPQPVPTRPPAAPPPLPGRVEQPGAYTAQLQEGGASTLGTLREHHLQSRLQATEAAPVRRDQSGSNVRRRLRIDLAGGTRRSLRTALLWNEILGAPRAYRGPHRWLPTDSR